MNDKEEDGHKAQWTAEHEQIFIEWADKAMCFRWLHSKANAMYSRLNAWYTIPVIVISTLTGTANFAQERVPLEYQGYFSMVVGGFNIIAGIITTVQQFLKITQLNESHRVSSIAWDKFYRNIKVELSKNPSERMDVLHMIKQCKEEFDRLSETSPIIPESILKQFKILFVKSEEYSKIIKPEICDIFVATSENINNWFSEENQTRHYNEKLRLETQKDQNLNKILQDFIKTFNTLHNREPLKSEIIDNLKDKIDVVILMKMIDDNKLIKSFIDIELENKSMEAEDNNV